MSRCRRRSARQGLPFVSILLISGCSKKVETQKADDLSQYKTEYVGDRDNFIGHPQLLGHHPEERPVNIRGGDAHIAP